ncbi:hypothetical protein [Massilia sp. H6]|uniref:hypothetical protein n=1 Tax=Massilia sp. H6 TaxID=2970464 RepID=UPI002169A037|nr:hypothetical protein [Massilia sp. H6]UVW28592.1 hypothetical protein NRS07_00100 [Massilia sp. H6]
MRHPYSLLLPLLAPLLLTGCVNDSASYRIDNNDHALTLRVVQDYFWSKEGQVKLTAARLPDCQRMIQLGPRTLTGLEIELFASGPNLYILRSGDDTWQVDTGDCTELAAPAAQAVTGKALGVFHLNDDKKLIFEAVDAAP